MGMPREGLTRTELLELLAQHLSDLEQIADLQRRHDANLLERFAREIGDTARGRALQLAAEIVRCDGWPSTAVRR